MAELTPIERVQKFFKREPIDKMPFFTGMGMVCMDVQSGLCGDSL